MDGPRRASTAMAVTVGIVATTVLIGWVIESDTLVRVHPGLVSMKLNTALCLLLLAGSSLPHHPVRRWLPIAVLLITTTTLVEHASGIRLGIDELLVEDFTYAPGGNPPGQMAIATAVSLTLLALALLTQDRGATRAPQWLACLALGVGFTAILGYAYDVSSMYAVVAYSSVAVHTAVALVLLSFAVLARQEGGIVSWLSTADDPGALVGRWLIGLALVGIPLLGGIRLQGEVRGWYDGRFGLALMVMSSTLVIVGASTLIGRRLSVTDRQRRQALLELSDLVESLREGRDEAWSRAERTALDLIETRGRFSRAIGQSDDQFCTLEVSADGGVAKHFATPDPRGLLSPLLADLTFPDERGPRGGGSVDVDELDDIRASIRAGRPVDVELHVAGMDGTRRWIWLRGNPRREHDELFHDLVATNIDERRALSDQLQAALATARAQADELLVSNRIKDEFIAMAGHELRTPLAVIRGNLELLDLMGSGTDTGPLATIGRRVAGMQVLVDDLFDLARLRSGTVSVAVRDVDLRAAVREVTADFRAAADAAGIELIVNDVPAAALCDPDRLHQMLVNLVGNAVKYTPHGATSTSPSPWRTTAPTSPSPTPASASARTSCLTSSNASSDPPPRSRATSPVRVWAWPSPTPWPRPRTATSPRADARQGA